MDAILGDCRLETLRRDRTGEKWTQYPGDVLPAFVAEMDFAVAEPIVHAVRSAVRRGDLGYPNPVGLARAVSEFFGRRCAWEPDPGRVSAAPDVMTGIAEVLQATTPPGSGVVINPPVYPPFFFRVRQCDRQLVEVPLASGDAHGHDRSELDFGALEQALSHDSVTAYLLCSPHNPLGRVWSREELAAVRELCRRYDVMLLVDEIHGPLTLEGATFTPAMSLVDDDAGRKDRPRTFVFTSASKAWNIPGLKCGVIVAGSAEDASLLASRWEALFPSHLGAIATEAAFRHGGVWLDVARRQLDENRRHLTELIEAELPGVGYRPPQAGFLAWLDCRALGLGDDPAAAFLDRGRVALSHGPDFGAQGKGFARLNFGTSPELVREAVRRMASSLAA